jgi:hypothetical protein
MLLSIFLDKKNSYYEKAKTKYVITKKIYIYNTYLDDLVTAAISK